MIAVYYHLVLKHLFNCWYSRLLPCTRRDSSRMLPPHITPIGKDLSKSPLCGAGTQLLSRQSELLAVCCSSSGFSPGITLFSSLP